MLLPRQQRWRRPAARAGPPREPAVRWWAPPELWSRAAHPDLGDRFQAWAMTALMSLLRCGLPLDAARAVLGFFAGPLAAGDGEERQFVAAVHRAIPATKRLSLEQLKAVVPRRVVRVAWGADVEELSPPLAFLAVATVPRMGQLPTMLELDDGARLAQGVYSRAPGNKAWGARLGSVASQI